MPDTPKKFYLTTPIYYVNARPHIGHAYSTIAADVIARRHRLLGDDTFFLTGTDEHGQKVQRSAEKTGIPPQQFANEVSRSFQDLWKRMGITNDDFIRTTDERHKRGVQHLWRVLEERGAIYLSSYTGQYCVSEEMFVDGPPGTIGPDGKPTETVTEKNYFFKLSEYQQPLIDLIESNRLHIQPEAIRNEVLSFLRGGIRDLSISRTTFDWGIAVPAAESVIPAPSESVILSAAKNPRISPVEPQNPSENHVVYVWLDALANYITAIGYGSDDPADKAKFEKYWPADLHLVGKEITRFHCVYWPAFLMAAGIPTPKSVVANGWLLFEESKMSKSRGNVVRTETILDAFGPLCPPVPVATDASVAPASEVVILSEAKNPRSSPEAPQPLTAPTKAQQDLFAADVIRYFLLREIPFGQDGSFSFDALITRYNADLANGYGNLVSRTLTMIEKYFDGRIPLSAYGHIGTTEFIDGIDRIDGTKEGAMELQHKLNSALDSYNFSSVLELCQHFIRRVNQFLSDRKPWKLDPEIPDQRIEREHVLYSAADALKNITFLLNPFMPTTTSLVWTQLGFDTPIESVNQVPDMVNLRNLKWGGLKPGTKLGPLAPIFPRADKGIAQIMTDMESPQPQTAQEAAVPESVSSVQSVADSIVAPTPEKSAQSVSSVLSSSPEAPPTPTITIDDFAKIDLRVAQIVVAERIPKADKLLRLEVDLGPGFTPSRRQILSGIAEFYTPEELIGKRIAIIANLAPRKMRGLESHGMLLAASGEDHSSKPILATFSDEIALGSRIR